MAYISALSAKVLVKEIDLTTRVPAVSTTEGGFVGRFNWGPIDDAVLIESENELIEVFGKPDNNNAEYWFSAANFAGYSNAMWTVRAADIDNANVALRAKNATCSNSSGFLVKNDDHYVDNYADGSLQATYTTGPWIAKYAGDRGNTLKVSICPGANAFQSTLTGTVAVTANSNVVTGTGSTFTTEAQVGDYLVINSEVHQVNAITNTTQILLRTRHVTGATSANTAVRRWEYWYESSYAPGTSVYAENLDSANDEMHIVVVDEDGVISGTPKTVLEVYENVSKGADAKTENGSSNYYKDVINQKSQFIRWAGKPSGLSDAGNNVQNVTFAAPILPIKHSLVGGSDGTAAIPVGNDELIRGWNLFRNKEDIDISFVFDATTNQTVQTHIINNIAEHRKDLVAFFSPPKAYVVDNHGNEAENIVDYRNTLPSTSYAALDCAWKYQYDRFNDVYRYIPCAADCAGIHVRSDFETDPWYAAAGLNRGHVKNVDHLAWNPSETDRDYLYKNGVNPIVTFKGDGTVLFGQKTLLARPSAFDRINVRRLFIVLEKAISRSARYVLFELNDEFTRTAFKNRVEPFLRDVQGRRGIYDFRVVCDETNNIPEVIDRNELVMDIYIKPARVAEYIRLNFIATRTGVDFNEIVGKVQF